MDAIIVTKDVKDKMGMTIPAGCKCHIKATLNNPMTKKQELILLIENGTGIVSTYPKSLVEAEQLDEAHLKVKA